MGQATKNIFNLVFCGKYLEKDICKWGLLILFPCSARSTYRDLKTPVEPALCQTYCSRSLSNMEFKILEKSSRVSGDCDIDQY